MLTLMSPPLGLGKRCPSKVAYKVDQPFLLRGLELSRSRGLRELREVVLGEAGEALGASNVCLARSWGAWCAQKSPGHAGWSPLPTHVTLPWSLASPGSSGVEDPSERRGAESAIAWKWEG